MDKNFYDTSVMLFILTVIVDGLPRSLDWHVISIGVLIPFTFVGMWILGIFFISRMCWIRFAEAYSAGNRPLGRSYPVYLLSLPGVRYKSVVRAIFNESGVYRYIFILCRAFHPPFMLPWSSIERVEPYSYLWTRGYVAGSRGVACSLMEENQD